MYGDRYGSLGRDDPQDGSDPQNTPWDARSPHDQAPFDDVKVAGEPISETTEQPVVAVPPRDSGAGYDEAPYEQPAYAEAAYGGSEGRGYEGSAREEPGGEAFDPEATRHDLGIPRDVFEPPQRAEESPEDEFAAMRRTPRSPRSLTKVGLIAAAAVVVVGGGTAGAFALTGGSGSPDKVTAAAREPARTPTQPPPLTDAQRKQLEKARVKELKKRASRAARKDHPKLLLYAKGTPVPTKTATPSDGGGGAGDPVPAGEAQKIARSLLSGYGWSPSSQFGCLVNLWNRESHWNTHASNPSGAYGIPQAKPGSKMATAGPDWQNNARTQIKWGLGYIKSRYSTPCGAWSHSESTGWY